MAKITIDVDEEEVEYYAAFTRIDEGPGEDALTVLIFGTGERQQKLAKEIAKLLDGHPLLRLVEALRTAGDGGGTELYLDEATGKAVVSFKVDEVLVDPDAADALWELWGEEGDWRG